MGKLPINQQSVKDKHQSLLSQVPIHFEYDKTINEVRNSLAAKLDTNQ